MRSLNLRRIDRTLIKLSFVVATAWLLGYGPVPAQTDCSGYNNCSSLLTLNIHSFSLRYHESKRHDQYGNVFRYRAKIYGPNNTDFGRWAYDVFLVAP